MCRQFRDWCGKYPELLAFPERRDYARRLTVLNQIANVHDGDDDLMGRTIQRIHNPWTPLFGVTGDSVIGELLLTRAASDAGARFEEIAAWLLWQVQRFHAHHTSEAAYADYLSTPGARLATRMPGRRAYEAYLALRSFTADDSGAPVRLAVFADLIAARYAARGRELALLFKLCSERRAGDDWLRYQQELLSTTRWTLDELVGKVDLAREVLPDGLGRLLTMIWLDERPRTLESHWVRRVYTGRDSVRPQIIHGKRLMEVLRRTDVASIAAGTVLEFFRRETPERRRARNTPEVSEDDPVEHVEQEPSLSVFIADDHDLLRGYYAAKGQQAAVEYGNALLRWSKWTLSHDAVARVVELIAGSSTILRLKPGDPAECYARLALGLSLLSARPLDEVAGVKIGDAPQVAAHQPIAIDRSTHTLSLYPGRPDVRRPLTALPPFCYPRATCLSLRLPTSWSHVVDVASAMVPPTAKAISSLARQLLRKLDEPSGGAPALRITEHGVRYAFTRALAECTHGDLGAQQVITEGGEADARNIIHYASYAKSDVEGIWRTAAETLVGPLPTSEVGRVGEQHMSPPACQVPATTSHAVAVTLAPGGSAGATDAAAVGHTGYVGAQHAFDVDALAAYFKGIRSHISEAENHEDWPRLFNLMTLYLSYWLGLGLAGRKTLAPVPDIVLQGGWALVADKHRADGSTDRLVPLTAALRRQIDAYVAFSTAFAVLEPKLDPIVPTAAGGELRLRYIHRTRGVIAYRPKFQETGGRLVTLPANWGRKLVRSESGRLPGRYRDAELGHWVRGRHAWDATSTFDVRAFHASWMAMQSNLEKRLGFEVVEPFPVCHMARRINPHPASIKAAAGRAVRESPPRTQVDAVAIAREVDPALVERLRRAEVAIEPGQVLDLMRRVIEARQYVSVDEQRNVAEAVCAWLRERTKIPIFATAPRPLFANQLVLSAAGLQTLAYLQDAVLPAFHRDLAHLPARETAFRTSPAQATVGVVGESDTTKSVDAATAELRVETTPQDVTKGAAARDPNAGVTDRSATEGAAGPVAARTTAIELGRLVMIAIWRLGLVRWPLVEAWLRALYERVPVLAQGANRYVGLQVLSSHARAPMHRTVFLDDFTSAYLVEEHDFIRRSLLGPLFDLIVPIRRRAKLAADGAETAPATTFFESIAPPRRRARVESAINAYLRSLGAGSERVSLTAVMAAATQSIMLRSAPIVAAYARGEIDTWDLGDAELRRLGGLCATRESEQSSELPLPAVKQLDLGDDELPRDLLQRIPILRALGTHASPFRSEWRRLIGQYEPKSATERLLCQFALWLLEHGKDPASARLSGHEKRYLASRIKVVSYALLGYTWPAGPTPYIDGDTLVELQEASRDEFPDRLQHGAWFRFHAFLNDKDADHAGFKLGPLGPQPERAVSAKILSAEELAAIDARLASIRSRLAKASLRTIARHHVDLMTTFGMRRAESAYLRDLDFQHDLCRVQAYGDHTLKTTWADRVVPIGFAAPSMRDWLADASDGHFAQLINAAPDKPTSPDNFFDKVSRVIQYITQDDSMGSHHFRHTLISRLTLTLLWNVAGIDHLRADLPWLEALRLSPEHVQALLGTEGDAGQGMRAVSALVGHSHPTTTLRHYVHVLGIALHGVLESTDTLDISRSFENRMDGKSTVQRWAMQARAAVPAKSDADAARRAVNRTLRDRIEARFKWRGIARNETPRPPVAEPEPDGPQAISLTKLEQVDRSLRDGQVGGEPALLATYQEGLDWLAHVSTGKKGKEDTETPPDPEEHPEAFRHALRQVRRGVWLPRSLPGGDEVDAADALCRWLEWLRTERSDGFEWLLQKWALASERERNRIRLDDADEVKRGLALEERRWVALRVDGAIVANERVRLTTKEIPRLRIKCRGPDGRILTRDTIAIRWVLSYVAAYQQGQRCL